MLQSFKSGWEETFASPKQRFEYYRDAICDIFTQLEPELSDDVNEFRFAIDHRGLTERSLTRIRSTRHFVRRTRTGIARSNDSDFYLNYQFSGHCVASQNDTARKMTVGRFVILDNSRPFEFAMQVGGPVGMRIVQLKRTPALEKYCDRLFDLDIAHSRHRLMPLLRMSLAQLSRADPMASDGELEYLGDSIESLVHLIIGGEVADDQTNSAHRLWPAIVGEVERNLPNGDFNLERLAFSFRASERLIQKIFAAHHTTFSEYLADKRLSAAANLMLSGQRGQSIEAIAYWVGYRDLSAFYRAFKRKYGVTPAGLRNCGGTA